LKQAAAVFNVSTATAAIGGGIAGVDDASEAARRSFLFG